MLKFSSSYTNLTREVCFYIPKKEQTKKDNLQSERAISSRWFGYRFLLWKQVPDHSSSTRSRKPEFTPLQIIPVARIDL